MSRRSSRAAPVPKAPAPAPGASKRRASARLSASEAEVKRVRSNADLKSPVNTTAEKSKYFESEGSADSDLESSDAAGDDSSSAYGEQEEAELSPTPDSGSDEVSDSEDNSTRPRAKGKQGRSGPKTAAEDTEFWREGVRTGLGPGKELFIPKPKARDAGDVPYVEHKLHPNTRLFLRDLAKNNDREWFKAHDPDYRAAKKDFDTFADTLTSKIIDKDATVPELPVKDIVFRIHRDTRFSKNPVPYKINMSAAWSRTGKKGPYAAYYVHFQPGASFVGCGIWHPEADPLATLREDIVEHADRWKEVLRSPEIRRELLDGALDNDDAVVKAFTHSNRESALKTKPKGYDANHKEIQLLRLRSFTLGRPLSDEEILADDAQERIAALVAVMEPFVTYLNSVVMPDQ